MEDLADLSVASLTIHSVAASCKDTGCPHYTEPLTIPQSYRYDEAAVRADMIQRLHPGSKATKRTNLEGTYLDVLVKSGLGVHVIPALSTTLSRYHSIAIERQVWDVLWTMNMLTDNHAMNKCKQNSLGGSSSPRCT